MQPLAGSSESPGSSTSALQPIVTEQGKKLFKNMARKEMRHRKVKLSLGFGQKYLYEGIWRPDKSRHLNWTGHA
jgi:hypothetical protein